MIDYNRSQINNLIKEKAIAFTLPKKEKILKLKLANKTLISKDIETSEKNGIND